MKPLPFHRAQRGIALITSLLMLVILTLLALSMFRSLGLQEKIAGNTREKQRSMQAAQSALQYAEWWLNWFPNQPGNSINALTAGASTTCLAAGSHYNANLVSNMTVCTSPLPATATTSLPWSGVGVGDYTPPGMQQAAGGGIVSATGDIYYSSLPSLYIQYLTTNGNSRLFLITAVGYGGSTSGATVLQSTYQVTACSGSGCSGGGSGGVVDNGFSTSR